MTFPNPFRWFRKKNVITPEPSDSKEPYRPSLKTIIGGVVFGAAIASIVGKKILDKHEKDHGKDNK